MDDASIKMEQLRKWRSRRKKDVSIDSMMSVVCRSLRKTNKQLVQIQDAWQEFVPQRLHQVAVPIALHSGVLEVSVDSSPTVLSVLDYFENFNNGVVERCEKYMFALNNNLFSNAK